MKQFALPRELYYGKDSMAYNADVNAREQMYYAGCTDNMAFINSLIGRVKLWNNIYL